MITPEEPGAAPALDADAGPPVRGIKAWEPLMATCPARAYEAYLASLRAPRPTGTEAEASARRELGLRADIAYIQQLHAEFEQADPGIRARAQGSGGGPWSLAWGCLVTGDEEQARWLWHRRDRLDTLADAARAYLARLPDDQVGGVWPDSHADTLVVALTDAADADTIVSDLQRHAIDAQVVRAVRMRWSSTQLREIQRTVMAALGRTCTSSGIDLMIGAVWVTVGGDVSSAEHVIAAVVDPCAVSVEVGDPPVAL